MVFVISDSCCSSSLEEIAIFVADFLSWKDFLKNVHSCVAMGKEFDFFFFFVAFSRIIIVLCTKWSENYWFETLQQIWKVCLSFGHFKSFMPPPPPALLQLQLLEMRSNYRNLWSTYLYKSAKENATGSKGKQAASNQPPTTNQFQIMKILVKP